MDEIVVTTDERNTKFRFSLIGLNFLLSKEMKSSRNLLQKSARSGQYLYVSLCSADNYALPHIDSGRICLISGS